MTAPQPAPERLTPAPFLLDQHHAPAYWLGGILWLVLASGMQTDTTFSLMEQLMPQGLGPCTHRHPLFNEGFYVLEGTCAFNAQGQTVHAGPGTLVHLPPMLPHSFSIESEEARVINFYTPAGFELVVMSCAQVAQALRRPTPAESAPPKNQEQVLILSDLYGQQAVTGMPFVQPSTPDLMRTQASDHGKGQLHVVEAAQVPAHRLFGLEWRVLATAPDTAAAYDVSEVSAPAGAGLPRHQAAVHMALYVLAGTLEISMGEEPARPAAKGAFVFVPAGTACAWHAQAGPARLLLFHLPGGFAEAVAQAGGDEDRARQLWQAQGVTMA